MIDWEEVERAAWYIIVVALIGIAVLALWGVASAWARWKPQYANADPIISKWYSQQHNSEGQWCCDKSDGHDYYDAYTVNKDGSVTLSNGHKIPASKVLSGPNPTGHAVYWFAGDTDFCFAVGPLG